MRVKRRTLWKVLTPIIALAAMALVSAPQATAQTNVFSEPTGWRKVSLLTNSDTYTSIPFTRPPEFIGLVASVSGSLLSVSNNPNWIANQWATSTANGYYPYHVMLVSGAREGAFYTITNNTANTLEVVLAPEDLSGVSAGDRVRILPYWSLGAVFPNGRGVVASPSALVRKTQVLFPQIGGSGINLSAAAVYYYYNDGWRKVGEPVSTDYGDAVILPDQYVIVRQGNGADTSTYLAPGQVVTHGLRIPLYANAPGTNLKQDNYVAVARPKKQSLNESGLSNTVARTVSALNRKDEVLTFDNTTQAINKAPSGVYYYYNNGWRKVGMPVSVEVGASNIFLPAQGVIVRRATNSVSAAAWVNAPNYSK